MLYSFQELFTSTTDSLRDRNVPVQEITRHLQLLGSVKSTYSDSGVPPLRRQLRTLTNTKNVDAVMSVIKDYCSFFNYRMLEHIIDKLGTYTDRKNLAKYKDDFKKYAECCVVEEGHSELLVTLDDSFDSCNLSHLDAFVSNLRKILKIPSSVKLSRIYVGSLKLIFHVPHSVQQTIFPLSRAQEVGLGDLCVTQVSCGNYQLTVAKQEKNICRRVFAIVYDVIRDPLSYWEILRRHHPIITLIFGPYFAFLTKFLKECFVTELQTVVPVAMLAVGLPFCFYLASSYSVLLQVILYFVWIVYWFYVWVWFWVCVWDGGHRRLAVTLGIFGMYISGVLLLEFIMTNEIGAWLFCSVLIQRMLLTLLLLIFLTRRLLYHSVRQSLLTSVPMAVIISICVSFMCVYVEPSLSRSLLAQAPIIFVIHLLSVLQQ